ncbi:hypothetical protein [Streptomyces aurantiogriseus]|uniref:Uncharacterized protein n=1 Tax=Streptomyces aurantiogriseus TaxID=66870 RepID=A0A918F6K5_9ACTN|nr:hypothetical protein [Streptomyces aurantiogriseus]GGR06265.1 hypothetical protein GCM10010251_22520 [Streptomyces aurantiogriseus]
MSLTDAEYAYLHSELGEAERSDLEARYQRLGSLRAVAMEVLRERRAALVADPLSVSVQGIATMSNAENVRAIERQIATLREADVDSTCQSPVLLIRRPLR